MALKVSHDTCTEGLGFFWIRLFSSIVVICPGQILLQRIKKSSEELPTLAIGQQRRVGVSAKSAGYMVWGPFLDSGVARSLVGGRVRLRWRQTPKPREGAEGAKEAGLGESLEEVILGVNRVTEGSSWRTPVNE